MLNDLKNLRVFDRITFNDVNHTYKIDGKPSAKVSVTGLVSTVKEKFDEEKWSAIKGAEIGISPDEMKAIWKRQNRVATLQGSTLHEYAENYYQNKICQYDKVGAEEELGSELHEKMRSNLRLLAPQFLNFYRDTKDEILPIKQEFVLGDLSGTRICGMLDMLAYNLKTNTYEIYDFKTNKEFNMESPYGKLLLPPLNHLDECEFNTYSLQLSFYKIFLQKYANIEIGDIKAVWFSVNNENYKIIPLRFMKDECATLIEKFLIEQAID